MITAGGIKETGILMSAPMVCATLSGDKTQTRRVVTRHNSEVSRALWDSLDWSRAFADPGLGAGGYLKVGGPDETMHRIIPRWRIGHRLWVRETWGDTEADFAGVPGGRKPQRGDRIRYRAEPADAYQWDHPNHLDRSIWRPSIHMPRWASRILLEITAVRPERLQLITEADCIAEGMVYNDRGRDAQSPSAHEQYYALWNSLNDDRGYGWEKNPWVWVITFRRIAA